MFMLQKEQDTRKKDAGYGSDSASFDLCTSHPWLPLQFLMRAHSQWKSLYLSLCQRHVS